VVAKRDIDADIEGIDVVRCIRKPLTTGAKHEAIRSTGTTRQAIDLPRSHAPISRDLIRAALVALRWDMAINNGASRDLRRTERRSS
jgi:hypothetical protein